MPVDQRIVEAHLQPLGPESVRIFPHQIPPKGGVGALVIGILAVKQAEALVMLGGQHRVLHARGLGLPGPFPRVKQVGIEVVKVFLILLFRGALVVFHPFVPGRQGVQAEVDEHAETIVAEPCGITGSLAGYVT